MIKLRSAYFCNLKLTLLWLVIFGHWIEPQIWENGQFYRLYRWIYLLHMPLFAFLSGLFLGSSRDCLRQLRRTLPLYLLLQSAAVLLACAHWHTPWWHLWYLLSLSCWLLLASGLLQWRRGGWVILLLSAVAGCLAGRIPWIGRTFSLSRTIVFFPYFWLGVLLPPDIPWHRLRSAGLVGLVIAVLSNPQMPVTALYQAGPCALSLRAECYVYSLLLGLFALSWCPRGRLPWTRAGADTMPAYLLHGPVVGLLRGCLRSHIWLWTTVFLYITHQFMRWNSAYGITGKEARQWPDLKSSTKPRENRSTGSS